MPLFNAIGQPRWNSPLIRFFGMKIGSAAAPSLSPEIAPSFDVNQQDDPTLYFLRGENLFQVAFQVAAAVGNYSQANIRNPAGSGVLCVVERVMINCGAATYGLGKIVADPGDYASVPGAIPADTRFAGVNQNSPIRVTSQNTLAVGMSTPWSMAQLAQNTPAHTRLILSPGFALILQSASVNTLMTVEVTYKFRAIPAEELQTG